MSLSAAPRPESRTNPLTLVALESLPCGCVSGVYRARPTVVELEQGEAKGPHCRFDRHKTGDVMRLGVPDYWSSEGEEPVV